MSVDLLNDRTGFVERTISRLGRCELDYAPFLPPPTEPVREAGVLFLLSFDPPLKDRCSPGEERVVLHLIKRSATVAQAGDLSCPGGMLDPRRDRFGSGLLRLSRIIRGSARSELLRRDPATRSRIRLFLANALRESWEEVHLPPRHVRFLGALPPYGLLLLKRRIFPIVGLLDGAWRPRINAEVEQIVHIPLQAFFLPSNYAWFDFSMSGPTPNRSDMPTEFPCLIHRGADGRREILWGATFNITMSFLNIVCDFQRPGIASDRVVRRTLPREYLHGRRPSGLESTLSP